MIGFDKNKIVKAEDLGVFVTMVAKELGETYTYKKYFDHLHTDFIEKRKTTLLGYDYDHEEPMVGLVFYNKENHSVCPVASYFAGNPVWYDVRRYKHYTENYKGEKVAIEDWRCGTETGFPLLDPTTKNPFAYLKAMKGEETASLIQKNFPKLIKGMPMAEFEKMYTSFLATQLNEFIFGEVFDKDTNSLVDIDNVDIKKLKYFEVNIGKANPQDNTYSTQNVFNVKVPFCSITKNDETYPVPVSILQSGKVTLSLLNFVDQQEYVKYFDGSYSGLQSRNYSRRYWDKYFFITELSEESLHRVPVKKPTYYTQEELIDINQKFMAFQMASLLHGEYYHKKERDVKPLLGNATRSDSFTDIFEKHIDYNKTVEEKITDDTLLYENDLMIGYRDDNRYATLDILFFDQKTNSACPAFAYFDGKPTFYEIDNHQTVSCLTMKPETICQIGSSLAGTFNAARFQSIIKEEKELQTLKEKLQGGLKISDFKEIYSDFQQKNPIDYYNPNVIYTSCGTYMFDRPIVGGINNTMHLNIAPTPKRFQVAKEQTIEKEK